MKSDDLKLRIMLLNGEEVDSQLLASAAAGGDADGGEGDVNGSDAEESDGSSDEEIDGERDRINSRRNTLLYGPSDEEEGEEQDIFEALKKRRQQYLAKTGATSNTEAVQDEQGDKVSAAPVQAKSGEIRPAAEIEPDDGGDTESMRLRLDDLEDSEEEEKEEQENNREADEDVAAEGADGEGKEGEKENANGLNVSLTGRRKRQKIIDSDSEEETSGLSPSDALKGDSAMVMDDEEEAEEEEGRVKRRASKKRERSENDDSDQENGDAQNLLDDDEKLSTKKPGGQMKVKRKRIVIADDDDDED